MSLRAGKPEAVATDAEAEPRLFVASTSGNTVVLRSGIAGELDGAGACVTECSHGIVGSRIDDSGIGSSVDELDTPHIWRGITPAIMARKFAERSATAAEEKREDDRGAHAWNVHPSEPVR